MVDITSCALSENCSIYLSPVDKKVEIIPDCLHYHFFECLRQWVVSKNTNERRKPFPLCKRHFSLKAWCVSGRNLGEAGYLQTNMKLWTPIVYRRTQLVWKMGGVMGWYMGWKILQKMGGKIGGKMKGKME